MTAACYREGHTHTLGVVTWYGNCFPSRRITSFRLLPVRINSAAINQSFTRTVDGRSASNLRMPHRPARNSGGILPMRHFTNDLISHTQQVLYRQVTCRNCNKSNETVAQIRPPQPPRCGVKEAPKPIQY